MTGYWLGVTVGLFLGAYIGIFLMIILRVWKKEDEELRQQAINKFKTM